MFEYFSHQWVNFWTFSGWFDELYWSSLIFSFIHSVFLVYLGTLCRGMNSCFCGPVKPFEMIIDSTNKLDLTCNIIWKDCGRSSCRTFDYDIEGLLVFVSVMGELTHPSPCI